jgi:hypothetical protein
MLNRMNLTLSARALSNRLNIGTRSLAVNASVNLGAKPQNIRQSHHGVMRDGMMWSGTDPIPPIGPMFPRIPSSFSPAPQRPSQDAAMQRSCLVADVQVLFELRPDSLVERPELNVSDCYPRFRTTTRITQTRKAATRYLDSRLRSKLSWLRGLKRDARATALQLAEARQATTGK